MKKKFLLGVGVGEGMWVSDREIKKKKENNMYSLTFCAYAVYKISSF